MPPPTLKARKRIQPRIDSEIIRLAKSKCAHQEVTLEGVIERLLAAWVAGQISLDRTRQGAGKTK